MSYIPTKSVVIRPKGETREEQEKNAYEYAEKRCNGNNYHVYDVGGGYFNVSINLW